MSDYTHLRKLDVTGESEAEYVFGDIIVGRNQDGTVVNPSIFFRPMVDANKAYLNERIRLASERANDTKAGSKKKDKVQQLADRLDEDRETDRVLIARTCALRWGTAPLDTKGKAHEFTPDECLSFLQALPNYMFEPLRAWVQNPYNFIDADAYATGGGVVNADALGNS